MDWILSYNKFITYSQQYEVNNLITLVGAGINVDVFITNVRRITNSHSLSIM